MLRFLIFDVIAAVISLFVLTATDQHPTTFWGWVRASVLSLPLTLLGFITTFALCLGFLWLMQNKPYGLLLFYQEPLPIRQYIVLSSLISGALLVAFFIQGVARLRAKRRRKRK